MTYWCLSVFSETRRKQNSLQHFSVMLPSVPASPHPSVASRDPLRSPTPSVHSGTNPDKFQSFHVPSPNSEHTTIKQEDVVSHREVSLTGPSSPQIDYEDDEEPKCEAVTPMTMTPGTPSTPVTPLTPMTPMTSDSLSDLSRPASSQFSYSTNLNSSLSNAPSGTILLNYLWINHCNVLVHFQVQSGEISLILSIEPLLYHSVN